MVGGIAIIREAISRGSFNWRSRDGDIGEGCCVLYGENWVYAWKWLEKNRRRDIGEGEWKVYIIVCSLQYYQL